MPAWSFRRIREDGRNDHVQATRASARLTSRELAEHMLCERCEQCIGVFERYVGALALQEDSTLPIRAQVTLIAGSDAGGVADASNLNVAILSSFALSILWRAAASKILRQSVSLGPYFDAVGCHLLGERELSPDSFAIVMSILSGTDSMPVDRLILAPSRGRVGASITHQFSVPGLSFVVAIGSRIDGLLQRHCLIRNRIVFLSDGFELVPQIASIFRTENMKGRLKTLRPVAPPRSST